MVSIKELSPTLTNQIAAGEVIERPASVVKELVENAIDAHSTQIDIHVKNAGLSEIEVIDNGQGIAPDDVLMAFKRHSTSKILTQNDLFHIKSLGFRGEALASIASVADLTLTTNDGSAAGSFVHLKGGEVVAQQTAASPQGTSIMVKDLFFNTPARLKYMKSVATELSNIGDIVNRLALSHPQISFTLTNDNHQLLTTNGTADLKQTIAGIYGVQNAKQMLPIESEDLDFDISGYIALPELTRSSRNYISIIINGRYIKNYQLNKAIIEGYGSKLMIGRYPVVVIAIKMDPILIDVNVHPTKLEVRLSKEPELMQLIKNTIRARLSTENLIPDAMENLHRGISRQPKGEQLTFSTSDLEQALNQASVTRQFRYPNGHPTFAENATTKKSVNRESSLAESTPIKLPPRPKDIDDTPIFHNPDALAQWDEKYQDEQVGLPFDPAGAVTEIKTEEPDLTPKMKRGRFPVLRYLAQLHGTYLLAEGESGLYLIDQHAAQERIKYEYYRKQIGMVTADLQNLMIPIVLDFSVADIIRINAHKEVLESVGVYVETFGAQSVIIHQHPTWFKAGQEESIFRELIDYVLTDGSITVAKFREKTAIMMSCKRSIKANHHLDEAQARQLLKDLSQTENPFNCPHGRPVLVNFTNKDLEKMFRRIQESHQHWEGE